MSIGSSKATQPVSVATMPTTPVTGPVTDSQLRAAAVPVSGPLTDTQLRAATLPVSLASLPTLAAGTNNIGRTTPAMQVARVLVAINFNSAAAAAADTLLSVIVNRAGVAAAAATTVAVTAGKTLRITGAAIYLRTTTAAVPWGLLTLRMNPSGAAVIGSPVIAQMGVSGTAAVIGNAGSVNHCMDEGLEFSGTQQIGLSFANNVATNVTAITLFGYEYTTPS